MSLINSCGLCIKRSYAYGTNKPTMYLLDMIQIFISLYFLYYRLLLPYADHAEFSHVTQDRILATENQIATVN